MSRHQFSLTETKIMTTDDMTQWVLPPEWHPQMAVQLTWPHENTDWKPYLQEITATFVELVEAIARYETVWIVAPHAAEVEEMLRKRIKDPGLMKRVRLHACDTDDTWTRDHGGVVLLPGNGNGGPAVQAVRPRYLDFRFNGWGEKFAAHNDNAINRRLFEAGLFDADYEDHLDFVLEGGSIESDGKGTVFTTSHCLLAPHRNQPLDRDGIEEELKRRLRARRIVWLDHGNLIGDDTDGHIDTIVRTAPDDTLLYIKCDDVNDEHHEDFVALEKQLMKLRTLDGKPYRLLPLPMADAVYQDGERLPATYANFLVINGAVVCPTYRNEKKDNLALQVIGEAFPRRDVIGIDSSVIIRQHGSIHCLTMQFPAEVGMSGSSKAKGHS